MWRVVCRAVASVWIARIREVSETIMRWIPGIALAALLPAANGGLAAQSSCPATPPPGATPFSDSLAGQLRGAFRLFVVTTTSPGSGPIVDSGWTLNLSAVDSARRAQSIQRRIGFLPRKHLLLEGHAETDSSGRQRQPAEMDDGILYIGCRDCNDASPTVLRVLGISEAGFWGSWRDYQTGIGYVVDREGKRAPDPAGHFCAIRIPDGRHK